MALTNHTTNPPRNHVRGQHEREFSFRDHQTLKQSQWKCRVCTFIFMREKAVIEEHLTESHGLTIEGYEGGRRRKRSCINNGGGGDEGRCGEGNSTDNDEFEPSRQDDRRQIESEANAADQVGSNLVTTEKVIGENSGPVEASKEPSEDPTKANDPKAATKRSEERV